MKPEKNGNVSNGKITKNTLLSRHHLQYKIAYIRGA